MSFQVMLVSDNTKLNEHVAAAARSGLRGMQVSTFADTALALSALDDSNAELWPRMLIVDLDRESAECTEALVSAVRADPRRHRLPVVAVASDENSERVRDTFGLGVNACARRPTTRLGADRLLSIGTDIAETAATQSSA